MTLFRISLLLVLLLCFRPALAGDTYPAGALTGNYQYAPVGQGNSNSIVAAQLQEWFDTSLATPGLCPVSLSCPMPVQIVSGGTGGGGGGWSGGSPSAPGYVTPVIGTQVESASNPGFATIEGSLPGFASTPTVNLGTVPNLTIGNFPALQAITATSLPLPTGASVSSLQPALNADGGALAHVANFPSTQPVTLPGNAGAITQATRTCTTTNATVQTANLATVYEEVQNTGSSTLWFLFSSGTAQTQGPSYAVLAGQTKIFSSGPDSFLPTGTWFCISSASNTYTIMYK